MTDVRIFDSSREGKRRSVLFALSLTTAFIGVVAATSTFLASSEYLTTVLTLLTASAVFVALSVGVYLGHFQGLVADDQLFWRILEVEE